MPGRVAQTDAATKPAARRRTVARKRQSTEEVPDEGADSSLRRAVCSIFADSQKSTASHRKCVIALRKLQEQCCYEPVSLKGKQVDEFDEDQFNNEFMRCVLRVLMVRKAEPAGDRVVRFLGTYLNTAGQKDMEQLNQEDPDETSVPETPTSRLTTQLLLALQPLLTSKDKTIRFRTTQVISHIINSLDSIDDNLFHLLRTNLLKRIHDKEGPVRLQAVYGLGRLAADVDAPEDDEDSDPDREMESGVLVKLLNVLQNDPSAEVRRNLLLNLPLNKEVLPYLLERARDADSATRRALYARLLPALGDFRHLSLTHREKLLRWGLRDRDDAVRTATAKLFRERWIENCAVMPASDAMEEDGADKPEQSNQAAEPSLDALLELLERIDVINSGAESGIALVAMQEFWQGRADYVNFISFPDTYWVDLTPELAFVARTFNAYCASSESKPNGPRSLESLREEKLPEVTLFGSILDRELKILIDTVRQAASGEDPDADEEAAQREFVVEQMLHMALTFDYSDEVGRRKMFVLMREALALPELPEEVTKLVIEVLRLVCGADSRGEREFCGVVLEAVAEVHDTIMSDNDDADTSITESVEDESFHSAASQLEGNLNGDKKASKKGSKNAAPLDEAALQLERERAIREIMVNMKCLHIAQCMLQNVACELEENVHLVTMLNNLIVPAVRSQEAPIRERGLVCLGLCCLLGKNLAEENLTLFMHCFNKGHPALQAIALQVIGDILVTHPTLIQNNKSADSTADSTADGTALLRQIVKAFSKSLKSSEASVQAIGVTALAKTMLSRLITDADLLKQLVVAYFDPETSGNAQLRQSLSYFLPVYCHSRTENAARMVSVVCPILLKLSSIREAFLEEMANVDEEDAGMVSLTTISNMLVDWTDPRKIFGFNESEVDVSNVGETGEVHFLLAETVLEKLVTSQISKDERKVLLSMLGKLYLPAGGCTSERVKTILELLTEATDSKVASDATGRNILSKLQTQLLKMAHDVTTELGAEQEDASHATEKNPSEVDSMPMEQDVLAEHDAVMTQLSNELRESTIGIPDAEGTRMMLHDDDDLLNSSEEDD